MLRALQRKRRQRSSRRIWPISLGRMRLASHVERQYTKLRLFCHGDLRFSSSLFCANKISSYPAMDQLRTIHRGLDKWCRVLRSSSGILEIGFALL